MMPMTPHNALYLVKQHNQDLLREAEADRLYHEVRRGTAHPMASLLAPLHAAIAAIARMGQQGVQEQVKPVPSGAELPLSKSSAS
jgi:hypothetical protein